MKAKQMEKKIIQNRATLSLTDEEMAETDQYFEMTSNPESVIEKTKSLSQSNQESDSIKNDLEKQFDTYLLEAIDEVLLSLGEPVKNTVYLHLENDFKMSKKEIPQKIKDFSDIMHRIVGAGACRLESMCIKRLSLKLGAEIQLPCYDWPLSKWVVNDSSFADCVNKMRKDFLKDSKAGK